MGLENSKNIYIHMNYRDFYKNNKSVWSKYYHLIPEGITPKRFERGADKEYKEHPQLGRPGAARVAAQHLGDNPNEYDDLQEKELLKGINLDDNCCEDGLPKREDGALDIEHDGRPIKLAKIVQIGAIGGGMADGEVSGYTKVGTTGETRSSEKDQGGISIKQDGDKEPITAGGKSVDSSLASKTVGSDVAPGEGQEQGGPNTKGNISGTPKIEGGSDEGTTFSLQEAKSKLRGMVKEVLKEITFDPKSGKWIRLNEGHKSGCQCGFCKNKGTFGKKKDDDKKEKEEVDENVDNSKVGWCRKCGKRFSKLLCGHFGCINCDKNGECERCKMNDDERAHPEPVRENTVNMKMGPSYKVSPNPTLQTPGTQDLPRVQAYEPEITEIYDEEEECGMQERYAELATAQRNLSESELDELKDLGFKLDKKSINEDQANMKMGPSYRVVSPHQYRCVNCDTAHRNQDTPTSTNEAEKQEEAGLTSEVSAPGQENWILKNKQRFIKQYGKKKGLEVLYGKAWKRSKGQGESVSEAGGAAVQHSSARTVPDGNLPQLPKNRHRGDIDEIRKKSVNNTKIDDRVYNVVRCILAKKGYASKYSDVEPHILNLYIKMFGSQPSLDDVKNAYRIATAPYKSETKDQ